MDLKQINKNPGRENSKFVQNNDVIKNPEGRWDGTMGGKGGRVFRNIYKGHMDKTKGGNRIKGGKWGWLGWGEDGDNCT